MPSFRKLACLVVNLPPAEDRFSQGDPSFQQSSMSDYSFTQISALCEVRTCQASLTPHIAKQPLVFVTKALMEPGTHFNSAILQPREAASSVGACPQLNNFAPCSYMSFTFPGEHVLEGTCHSLHVDPSNRRSIKLHPDYCPEGFSITLQVLSAHLAT